jgi:iron complex transport system permease protein
MFTYYAQRRRWLWLLGGLAVVGVIVVASAARGTVDIPPSAILGLIARRIQGGGGASSWPASWETILFTIRLPRVLLAGMTGLVLGVAGATYQGLLRNPLADPYLIGVAAGAGLGATIAIVIIPGSARDSGVVALFAFVGATGSTALIYNLARVGRTTPMSLLILAGVAVGAFLSSIMSFLMFTGGQQLRQVLSYLLGSFALAGWRQVTGILPYTLLGLLGMLLFARSLNVLQLDEEQAAMLGLDVERVKLILIAAASLATAAAVAVSGLVGFVGLIVPHAVRLVWGPDHRFADSLARTLFAPEEIPVGVITALCGAPFFLYLLHQKKVSVF